MKTYFMCHLDRKISQNQRHKYHITSKCIKLNNTEFLSGCRCETQLPKQANIIALTL